MDQPQINLIDLFNRYPNAYAIISGSPEYRSITGLVYYYQIANGVFLLAQVQGLPHSDDDCAPNIFGFHIHEGRSCTGNTEDPFKDTGGHYNPHNCPHPAHAGDLPPLFGNNGYAFMAFFTNRFSVRDVIGRTVIIHSKPDDFTSQPSGNSGLKIACGLITAAQI